MFIFYIKKERKMDIKFTIICIMYVSSSRRWCMLKIPPHCFSSFEILALALETLTPNSAALFIISNRFLDEMLAAISAEYFLLCMSKSSMSAGLHTRNL